MSTTTPSRPTHKLYRVVKGLAGEKDIWTEIAACWPHRDGNGFAIRLKPNETPAPGADYVMRRDSRGTPASR